MSCSDFITKVYTANFCFTRSISASTFGNLSPDFVAVPILPAFRLKCPFERDSLSTRGFGHITAFFGWINYKRILNLSI